LRRTRYGTRGAVERYEIDDSEFWEIGQSEKRKAPEEVTRYGGSRRGSDASRAGRGEVSTLGFVYEVTQGNERQHAARSTRLYPEVGIPIHQCVINHDSKGQTTIAVQPTPDPCMLQNGDSLEYSPTPNGPLLFNYVAFDIVSEHLEGKQ